MLLLLVSHNSGHLLFQGKLIISYQITKDLNNGALLALLGGLQMKTINKTEKFEIVVDFKDPEFGIVDLKLPANVRRRLRMLYTEGVLDLESLRGLNLIEDDDFNTAIMSFLMEPIYIEIFKALSVTGAINTRSLAMILQKPYSRVYEAVQMLEILSFAELVGDKGRQGIAIILLVEVQPFSERAKYELEHPEELKKERRKWLKEAEIAETKFTADVKQKLAKLRDVMQ